MKPGADTAEKIAKTLIENAGFQRNLIERDYRFAHKHQIPLAGFAYRPLDARSACVGVVTLGAASQDIETYRDLGAPLLLMESDRGFDLWRVGASAGRDARIEAGMSVDGTGRYFREHQDKLRPMRLYEAKTAARIERLSGQLTLFSDFVDPDLLPQVEGRIGIALTAAVVSGIRSLIDQFEADQWVIKAVFRLLAGKILRDKGVPGFKSATLSNVEELLDKVERHYGSKDRLKLSKKTTRALEGVMTEIQSLGDLRNLTTESLGDVYEQALITPKIREIHGTHKTPGYLVDYLVWQIAKWIEDIPVDELRFFEPGCGHAPFLVSVMRLLRTQGRPIRNFSQFVRSRFTGVDNDAFALEIGRLALTVADEPNSNGWMELKEADMYAAGFLEKAAAESTVLLTNPPYEERRAEELLFRTLPYLPVGAVFGAIVPASLLFSDKKRTTELRSWMISRCQVAEVDIFPDGLFTFGDHECALIAGRVLPNGIPTESLQTRLRRVADNDTGRKAFQADYQFGSTRLFPQSDFATNEDQALWVAEFQNEIWIHVRRSAPLSSIAAVNQGMQFKGRGLPKNAKTVSDDPFPDSVEGFASSSGDWGIHEQPEVKYFNLSDDVIRRSGTGTDRVQQVLLNHHPVSRGTWCLKPFVDQIGRVFQGTYLSVRPYGDLPLIYIWALLTSPLANLFIFTNKLKRDVLPRILLRVPVPTATNADVERIASIARSYLDLVRSGPHDMYNPGGYKAAAAFRALSQLDAEVLRLYDLPAKAERLLLDQFRGVQRPGVPFAFTEYYPVDTPDVPLYAYLSQTYQRALGGSSAELASSDLDEYDALCEKADTGKLSKREAARLHALQAEVDGRDYWMRCAGKRPLPVVETTSPTEFEQKLRALSDRAATASINRSKP